MHSYYKQIVQPFSTAAKVSFMAGTVKSMLQYFGNKYDTSDREKIYHLALHSMHCQTQKKLKRAFRHITWLMQFKFNVY